MADDKYSKNRQTVYDLLKSNGYTDDELGGSADELFKDRGNAPIAYKALNKLGYTSLADDENAFLSLVYEPENEEAAPAEETQTKTRSQSRTAAFNEYARQRDAARGYTAGPDVKDDPATAAQAMEVGRRRGQIPQEIAARQRAKDESFVYRGGLEKEEEELKARLAEVQADNEFLDEYERRKAELAERTRQLGNVKGDIRGTGIDIDKVKEDSAWLKENEARYEAARAGKAQAEEIGGQMAEIEKAKNAIEDRKAREEYRKHLDPQETIARGTTAFGYDNTGRKVDGYREYSAADDLLAMADQEYDKGSKFDSGYEDNPVGTAIRQFVEGGLNNVDKGSLTMGLSEYETFKTVRDAAEKNDGLINGVFKKFGYDDETANKIVSDAEDAWEALKPVYDELKPVVDELKAMEDTLNDLEKSGDAARYQAVYKQYKKKYDAYAKRMAEYKPLQDKVDKYNELMKAVEDATTEGLTDGERAVLDAFGRYTRAQGLSAMTESTASKSGAGAEQSLEFMLDFILTKGLGKAGTKAAAKIAANSLLKRKLGETGAKIAGRGLADAATSLARTSLMFPRNLAAYGEQLVAMDGEGSGVDEFGRYTFDRSRANAALNTALSQYVEYWSEGFGEYFGAAERALFRQTTMAAPKVAIGQTLKNYKGSIGKYLDYGKFDGMLNEMLEEVVGSSFNALNGWLSGDRVGDKEALKQFFAGENLATLTLSFLPMSAFGAVTNMKAYKKMTDRYNKAVENLGKYNFDRKELEDLASHLSEMTPEQAAKKIEQIADDARNKTKDKILPDDFGQDVISYLEGTFAMNLEHDVFEENREKLAVANAYAYRYENPNLDDAWDLAQEEEQARNAALAAGFTEEDLDKDCYVLSQEAAAIRETEPERSKLLLDYATAKGQSAGTKDGYDHQTDELSDAFERDVRLNVYVNGSVTRARMAGMANPVYIVSEDADVTPDGRVTTPTGDGVVKYRESVDGEVKTAKADQFSDAQAVPLVPFLDENRRTFRVAREQAYDAVASTVSPDGKVRALANRVGQNVFVTGNGAYEPVTVVRMTKGGENVVITGDKEALKGVATALGIQSPGGTNLEVPVQSLYPFLATEADGSLSTDAQQEAAPKAPASTSQNAQGQQTTAAQPARQVNPKDLQGTEQKIRVNGQDLDVLVTEVRDNGDVWFETEDENGRTRRASLPASQFTAAMQEAAGQAPMQEQAPAAANAEQPAPAPAEAPVQAETQTPVESDFRGNPIPMKDGAVDQETFRERDPEAWARWAESLPEGDERKPSLGTRKRLEGLANAARKAAEKVRGELDKLYEDGASDEKIQAKEKEIRALAERQRLYEDALANFEKPVEAPAAQAPAQDAAPEAEAQAPVAEAPAAEGQTEAPVQEETPAQEAPKTSPRISQAPVTIDRSLGEKARQIPLKKRVAMWEKRTGVSIEVLENIDQVKNKKARREILAGKRVTGWYDKKADKVYIYLRNVASESEIDKTYIHEVLAHKGLPGLLGETGWNSLMDSVWKGLSPAEQTRWMRYEGVADMPEGSEDERLAKRRKAADEYVAHLVEKIDTNVSAWRKFVTQLKEVLLRLGIKVDMGDKDFAVLIKQSLNRFERMVERGETERVAAIDAEKRAEALKDGVSSETQAAQFDDSAIHFNIRTEESVEDKIREFAKTKEGRKLGWTDAQIDSIIGETADLMRAIHAALSGDKYYDEWAQRNPTVKVDWRDGEEKPTVTWSRANIEYKYDMSADLLCINNEGLETVLASPTMVELMLKMNESAKTYMEGFTSDDYLRLYETLRDMGFVVPCKGCFDAAARLKVLPSVSKKFVEIVNKTIDERNRDPEAFDNAVRAMAKEGDATTVEGFPAATGDQAAAIRLGVAGDKLTEHISWTQLMSAEGQTKALSDWGGIFRAWQKTGAAKPKDKLLPEPWSGDIVSTTTTIIGKYGEKTPSYRDINVNQGTGLRRNSHSEFRPLLAIDEIQFMREAFIRGLTVFKYMKELDDVRLFGQLGVKFNMSFFPAFVEGAPAAGLDANGDYIAAEESVGGREFEYVGEDGKTHYDGMKGWREAQKYVNKDVSLSSVIFSIPHLIKAFTDVPTKSDPTGMWGSLIPFHASGATAGSLKKQGLGSARAISEKFGHGFDEAMTDYDKGVTNFEAVQNDRFGEGWTIVEGKKAGTDVKPGHKLEFADGTHYYNENLGLHLFKSVYIFDSEIKEHYDEAASVKAIAAKYGHPYSIDYNDKVREIGTDTAYQDAADYYIENLRKIGLIPRFDFEVPEDTFLKMCADAKVDPNHPKLGWRGPGNSWSPVDSEAYYSLFCDYGMIDPETGKLAPHNPVGIVDADGNRTFKLPDNTVDIVKDGVARYSDRKDREAARVLDAIEEFARRTVAEGKLKPEDAEAIIAEARGEAEQEDERDYGMAFRVAEDESSPAPVFFSNAAQALGRIKMDKATPEQWLKMLEKEGGLKSGEDKWIGLSDWLKSQDKKSLTRQEVADYIAQNEIQVEEQQYSEDVDAMELAKEDVRNTIGRGKSLDELQAEIDELVASEEYKSIDDHVKQDYWLHNQMVERYGEDFDIGYWINEEQKIDYSIDPWDLDEYEIFKDYEGTRKINSVREKYTTDGLENKREIALTVPTIEPWKAGDDIHFGDAGNGRAVAWVRFGDTTTKPEGSGLYSRGIMDELERKYGNPRAYDKMTDEDVARAYFADYVYRGDRGVDYQDYKRMFMANDLGEERAEKVYPIFEQLVNDNAAGNRVLVIDEIQSKRHQEAREKGYKTTYDEREKALFEKFPEYKEVMEGHKRAAELEREIESGTGRPLTGLFKEDFEKYKSEIHEFNELENAYHLYMNNHGKELQEYADSLDGRIPKAPFEKNWHELAMKRMLRLAAEEGYDYVAWTTGDQQAERYNIGGVVDRIVSGVDSRGKRHLVLYPKDRAFIAIEHDGNGNIVNVQGDNGAFSGAKNISDIIGKELAEQALQVTEPGSSKEFSGDGLKYGGEGMKGFYDDILPRFMNKYGKKWGVKVSDITLPNVEEAGRVMHAVPVTQEMKESVMQGQPMFRVSEAEDKEYMDAVKAGDMEKAGQMVRDAFKAAFPNTKVVDENGEPLVVWRVGKTDGYNVFDENRGGNWRGFYFTNRDAALQNYATGDTGESQIRAFFLDSKNPYMENNFNVLQGDKQELIDMGYDGMIFAPDGIDARNFEVKVFEPNQIKSADPVTYDDNGNVIPLSERFNPENDDIRFSIRGIRGAENDATAMENLEVAKEMESEGKDAKTIWAATGWEKGADGKWRSEIKDAEAKVFDDGKKGLTVGDAVDAPELFEAYPELKEYKLVFKKMAYSGKYDEGSKTIYIDPAWALFYNVPKEQRREVEKDTVAKIRAGELRGESSVLNYKRKRLKELGRPILDTEGMNTLIHELQHAIQGIEGFARGGNVEDEKRKIFQDAVEKDPNVGAFAYFFSLKNSISKLITASKDAILRQLRWAIQNGRYSEREIELMQGLESYLSSCSVADYVKLVSRADKIASGSGKRAFENYKALSGEVEARNAEKRSTMPEEYKRETPPSETEDTARADQEVRFRVDPETDSDGESETLFRVREGEPPQKTQKVYKLMRLGKDGKLYPLFIDSGSPIERKIWYDADSPALKDVESLPSDTYTGTRTIEKEDGSKIKEDYKYASYIVDNETGEAMSIADFKKAHKGDKRFSSMRGNPNKDAVNWATENGMRWIRIEEKKTAQKRYGGSNRAYYNYGINGANSVGLFAMRPGWHAGSLPTMRQIGKGSGKNLRDDRFVWVEGYVPADIDYNEEAQGNPDKDIPTHIPENGYYLKATNANAKASQADRVGWYVAGSFYPDRIISDSEARKIVDDWNAEHPDDEKVEYDWPRESGKVFNAETMQLEEDFNTVFRVGGSEEGRVEYTENQAAGATLDRMAETIGVKVDRVGRDEMPAGHKSDKGYYDPATDKMTLCMDNVTDERDAVATVIHETVAYDGLGEILGPRFNESVVDIYASLDNRARTWVNAYIKRHGLDFGDGGITLGIAEYMANLADTGNYRGDAWGRIGDILGKAVDAAFGTEGFVFTDRELDYVLRASYEHLKNPSWMDTPVGRAKDTLMKRQLGINETDPNRPTDPDGPGTGVLFRVGDTDVAKTEYGLRMERSGNKMLMENQDADIPVRIGYEEVLKEKYGDGWEERMNSLPDDENYLVRHNIASSRAESEAHNFEIFQFTPMLEQVRAIQARLLGNRSDKESRQRAYERILDYLYAVSALERNAWKNAQVDQAEQRDWSGITSLMGRPANEWREAEADASAMIDAFRAEVNDDAMLDELWDRIRACTDYSLDHAYRYGLLTRAEYEKLRGTDTTPRMWNYYLPLRGFTEKTAEEEFNYSNLVGSNQQNPVVKKMNGRWTQADNPLANILNIAETEIAQGNDNWARQALYNFVVGVGENSLLTDVRPWYVKENGKWVLAEPAPVIDPVTGVQTGTESLEDFEARMQGLHAQGLAKWGHRGLHIDQIMANKGHRNEHMVHLKVAGVDKMVWVNGNPALARAVNGFKRGQNMQLLRRASRALSNLFTTYSLDFTVKNLIRDTIYSRTALMVKEDRAYRHQFRKNWWSNFGYGAFAFPMVRLAAMWESGELQRKPESERTKREQMFIDFMTDGGQTGYTIINSVNEIKKSLERSMRRAGKKVGGVTVPVFGHYARLVKTLNEGFELLTRFTAYETSRDMGRSGQRAAHDAKEISVNFNRRGAQSGEGVWGSIAAYLGATHYFYNAGVQGFDNYLRLYKASPVGMSFITAGLAMMGALTPMINSMLAGAFGAGGDGGDDDWYWNLPEWVRRNNVILGYKGFYLAIPLPVEFRAPYGIGDIAGSAFCYQKYPNRNGFKVAGDIVSTAMGILPVNPVEGYTGSGNLGDALIRAVFPDAGMFFVDWATNRDYTGRPLQKENPFSHTAPKSQGAYASTPKALVEICQSIGQYTGVDIAPGVVRDLFNNYGGGFSRVAEDLAKLMFTDEVNPFRYDNIPFLSGFTGHIDEDRSNAFAQGALNEYKTVSDGVVRELNLRCRTSDISMEMAYDEPDKVLEIARNLDEGSVFATAKVKKILDSEEYRIGQMYRDGMNNKYKMKQYVRGEKKGQWYKSKEIEKEGVTSLKKKWKDLREEWARMPNKTPEEKSAKAEMGMRVQDAWHKYYDAEADLAEKLMNYEYGNK